MKKSILNMRHQGLNNQQHHPLPLIVTDKFFPTSTPISILSTRRSRAHGLSLLIALLLAVLGWSLSGYGLEDLPRESSPYPIEVGRWTEAEKIFRSNPFWLGGDGAISVDLGQERVLWLFGDSFINLSGSGVRRTADLVRNSLAIQRGYNPLGAEMQFFWKMKGPQPAAFFPPAGEHWFWPASGIMIGRHLLIFLMEIKAAGNILGFEVCGWRAVRIDNPHEKPHRWILTYLKSPRSRGFIIGCGDPVLKNGFLQVFALEKKERAVYLVRWPERSTAAGTLASPQWWGGENAGWIEREDTEEEPRSIFAAGQTEFSVEYVPQLKCYLQIQTLSLMNPCLAASTAKELPGPWSGHRCFFDPPEKGVPGTLIYGGKSHPMLRGAEMVFTYVVNTTREERLLKDLSIYFPVMLKGRINTERIPR